MLIKESKLRKIIRQELKSILNELQKYGDAPPDLRPMHQDRPMGDLPDVIRPGANRKEVYSFMRSHLEARAGKPVRLSGRNMRKYADRKTLSQFRKWYRSTGPGQRAAQKRAQRRKESEASGAAALDRIAGKGSLKRALGKVGLVGDPKASKMQAQVQSVDPSSLGLQSKEPKTTVDPVLPKRLKK